jgi:hypothetical protein
LFLGWRWRKSHLNLKRSNFIKDSLLLKNDTLQLKYDLLLNNPPSTEEIKLVRDTIYLKQVIKVRDLKIRYIDRTSTKELERIFSEIKIED